MKTTTGVRPAPMPRRRWAGWWAAGGVATVLVLLMVAGLAGDRGLAGRPAAAVGAAATDGSANRPATMPELVGGTEEQALTALRELEVPTWHLRYRHDPDRAGTVLGQSIEPGTPVQPAPPVTLEVATQLSAPVPVSPPVLTVLSHTAMPPTLTWDPVDSPVPRWRVTASVETCQDLADGAAPRCRFPKPGYQVIVSGTPSLTIPWHELYQATTPELPGLVLQPYRSGHHTGWFRWRVEALDHFGNPGPASPYSVFLVTVGGL